MGGRPSKGTSKDMRLSTNKKTAKANTSARKPAMQSSRGVKGK